MNCTDFEQELQERVELRSAGLSDCAREHAAQCATCHAAWRDHQLLAAALVALPAAAPRHLADTILNDILNDTAVTQAEAATPLPDRIASRPHAGWTIGAVAASLLAVASLGLLVPTPSPAPRVADTPPATDTPALADAPVLPQAPVQEPLEVATSVAAVLSDLRNNYQVLATETSATARDLAQVIPVPATVPAAVPWTGVSVNARTNEPAAGSSGVVEVGRSIGTQIAQAVDFLWLTVPDEEPRS